MQGSLSYNLTGRQIWQIGEAGVLFGNLPDAARGRGQHQVSPGAKE